MSKKYKYTICGIVGRTHAMYKNHPWTEEEWKAWSRTALNLVFYMSDTADGFDSSVLNVVDPFYIQAHQDDFS